MKRTYLLVISSVVAISIIIVLTLMQVRSVRSGPQASTPTPTYSPNTSQLNPNDTNILAAMPTAIQPKITDLAPNVPYEDKPAVVVQHADGSREMFLVAPDTVDAFIKNLPKGDKLGVIIPPPSSRMTHEAPSSTPEQSGPLIMRSGVPLKMTDLSPDVDDNDKGMLIIRHADGSEEAFLIAPDLIDRFISQLPKEDKLVQIISPGSIESAHP
jgi:hypothetical protein